MRLLWIDLEMTGLNVETEVVIEVAAVVSDLEFKALHSYHSVVKQPQHYLDNMDDWNQKHHTDSGLLKLIPTGRTPEQVEADLIAIVDEYFPGEKPILCGNSIAQDRLFIDKYFRKLAGRLHYRMLDVTSWKILFASRFGVIYQKRNAHRAVDDILESMEELKHYLSYVKVEKSRST